MKKTHLSPRRATLELIFASALWGFGFIATRFALEGFDAFWLNALRFLIATAIALPFALKNVGLRQSFTLQQFWLAAPAGLSLGIALILQTFGLKYTLVSKSAFITTLYIVFVPVAEVWLLRARLPKRHWLFVGVALVGAYLICRPEGGSWNLGDLLTLGCSLLSTYQIVELERASPQIRSSFVFNMFQGIWAGIPPLLLAIMTQPFPAHAWTYRSTAGLFTLACVSTMLAFLIQVRAQKVIRSSTASLLFLLESPFAALYAYFIFGEMMGGWQWMGAGLIAVATVIAVLYQPRPKIEVL